MVLVSAVVELWLIGMNTSWADIEASVPDEALFIEEARVGFAHYGYGYGPVFWGPLELLLKVSPERWEGLIARISFDLLKYAAIGVVGRCLWQKNFTLASVIFVLAILASPGYLFLGKIISPEYELLLWTALSAKYLIEDEGQLGKSYLWAVFYGSLAALTKLNGLPLLCILIIYGGVFGYWDWRTYVNRKLTQLILKVAGLVALIFAALLLVTWPRNLLSDIRLAFTLVPPLEMSVDVILFAWNYDGITWDQIKQGGIFRDFLPTFVLGCLAVLLVFPIGWGQKQRAAWAILSAALAIMLSTVFHNMGHTWYLFLPMFLFAIAGSLVMSNYSQKVQIVVIVILLVALIASFQRVQQRVDYKLATNRATVTGKIEAVDLIEKLTEKYPCITSANFDVLIPWEGNQREFIPMRMALGRKNSGNFFLPDVLVVNNKLPSGVTSPLLGLVVQGAANQYRQISYTENISVYVRNDLKCTAKTILD